MVDYASKCFTNSIEAKGSNLTQPLLVIYLSVCSQKMSNLSFYSPPTPVTASKLSILCVAILVEASIIASREGALLAEAFLPNLWWIRRHLYKFTPRSWSHNTSLPPAINQLFIPPLLCGAPQGLASPSLVLILIFVEQWVWLISAN